VRFLLSALAICPALPVAAQSPVGERAQFFGEVDVSVFNLEVFVTDGEGRPVPGLGVEDFELLVDGRPTPILNFFAGGEARPGAGRPQTVDAGDPARVPHDQAEDQRLNVVVVIDNTSIRPTSRNRVVGTLKEILAASLGPEDRVIVATQGPGLAVRHGFADPVEELGAVLDTVAGEIASTAQFESERLAIISELKRAPAMTPGGGEQGVAGSPLVRDDVVNAARSVLERIHSYQQWRYDVTRQAAADLGVFMDALAGLPGRKALLFVGEGTPFRVAETLYQAWDEKYQFTWIGMADPPSDLATLSAPLEANRRNLQRVYEAVAARAAASRITFYAIDAGQELTTSQSSAEHPGYSGASLHETARLLHQQQSLQLLAAESGGRHFTNLENVGLVVGSLAEDFAHYYSLGFAPPGAPDGEYRPLEVRVRRPGLTVRHRSGFRDKTLGDLMADRLQSALTLDVAENPLGVRVEPLETDRVKRGQYRLRLLARVPIGGLLLVPQAGEHLGRISAWVAVADEFGGTSEVHGRRLPVRIPDEQLATALEQDVGYALDILVGGGRQRVAVLVRDEIALITSTVTLEVLDGKAVALARLEDEAAAAVVEDRAEAAEEAVAEDAVHTAEAARRRDAVGVQEGRGDP
jgi:VWFA-related protein